MTLLTLRSYKISSGYLIWILSISCLVFASNSYPAFTEKKVSEIVTQLTSSCDSSVCHNTDVVELITHGSLSQYDQIMHVLNEKGPLCLRFVIEAFKDKLEKQKRIPINCDDFMGKARRDCRNAQADDKVMNDRVLSLLNLMVSKSVNLIVPFAQYISENKTPLLSMNEGLLNLLQRLENERSCSEYEIGEERKFIITPFQSKILPYTYYRIRRESEKHYKVFVVLKFFPGPGYDGSFVPNNQAHTHYMKKVRDCINKANSKMKGPDGEILEIVIEDAHQVDACRTKHFIEVGISYKVYTVNYFHSGMSCAAITHEILHVLGLWDEYLEQNREPNHDFDTYFKFSGHFF